MAKQMVDNGAGATANIEAKKTLAQEHDCRLAYPFHQRIFLFDKTIDDREFHADYARAGGHGDACLGLSMNWCQSRAKGQSDEIFFHKLADYRGDALLPRVLGFQHIEQRAFKDKTDNAERMLRETLPKLGMTLERSPGSAPPAHRAVMLNDLAPYLNAVLQPGKNQTLLLLSEHHAMALHQDTQGSLHFFDPLFGVVQADSIERLSRFLSDVFNRDAGSYWSKADRRLQISQVGAGPDFQLR
ncbi:Type III effector HopN1 [Pseudomonas coronafaciens pv. zizaniae]|nr:Type III effector HopN1 [Pseudomonas coronafaciens pv. zizaniae]